MSKGCCGIRGVVGVLGGRVWRVGVGKWDYLRTINVIASPPLGPILSFCAGSVAYSLHDFSV